MVSMAGRWFAGVVVMSGAFLAGAAPARAGVDLQAEAAEQGARPLRVDGQGEAAAGLLSRVLAEASRRLEKLPLRADAGASGGAADGAASEERVEKLSGALEDLKKALKLKPSKGERKEIMEAMKTLKKQLAAAKKALKAEGGTAAGSGAASSSGADAGACAQGMVKGPDTAGNCCWPGQEWSVRKDRCLGVPTCPEGLQAYGDACAAPKKECPIGQVANADTADHCCWPGQEWSKGKSRCIGTPECPGDLQAKGEECRDAAKDAAARVAQEAAEEAVRAAAREAAQVQARELERQRQAEREAQSRSQGKMAATENDRLLAAAVQAAMAAEGSTDCERGYNGMAILLRAMPSTPGSPGSRQVPAREAFLAVCGELPLAVQKCLVPAHAVKNQVACDRSLRAVDPKLMERMNRLMGILFSP